MNTFNFSEEGEVSLITTKNGRTIQLAVSRDMHTAINAVVAQLSKNDPLLAMGEEYDLVLKSTVEKFKP